MERTPPPQAVPSLLSVSAAALRFFAVSTLRAEKAHPFAVVACYTALRTDYFYTKISKIVPRRPAFYVRHRRRGRQMQGGWRES